MLRWPGPRYGIDLAMDLGRQTSPFHASVEGSAIVAAVVGVVLGARRLRAALHEAQDLREQARTLSTSLDATRREAERWRRDRKARWNPHRTPPGGGGEPP
jgi:uncharacterized protein (DUF3084 family)